MRKKHTNDRDLPLAQRPSLHKKERKQNLLGTKSEFCGAQQPFIAIASQTILEIVYEWKLILIQIEIDCFRVCWCTQISYMERL